MKSYDVVVIGSGTAGQTAAYALEEQGFKVAVIEKSPTPGGTCALYGCQAKKWFYETAEAVSKAKHLQGLGITQPPEWSWEDVLAQKNAFTSKIPDNAVNGLQGVDIDFIPGEARFQDKETLVVNGGTVHAKWFIIASGAEPMPLPIDGAENMITSTDFLGLKELPEKILFVGGGFISFECAHFCAGLGPKDGTVTILEAGPRPLGPFDSEMVELLTEASRDAGIDIRTGVKITSIVKQGDGFKVLTENQGDFQADLVVHGAGRSPDISGLDLEKAGVEFERRGIKVDASMRTSNPRIFAVGDCAATIQLARVADKEAAVCANNIIADRKGAGKAQAMVYDTVPFLLFTYPQYGMVGKTEDALKKEGLKYYKSFGKHVGWPTYRRVGMKHAAYKILVDENNMILGAHILSDNASGLLNLLRTAMMHGVSAEDLHAESLMTPYPSRESDVVYMLKPLIE
ncbi:dihydrolipoyl dehydrogenase family protein [Desulfatibacillum aliphaticivorans]|uniref:dihydrolipoyl dehydrogenase family protein n=1 Tax=Desulfatibacillum aliphaticivorans TaxID=218208 RepID=UPI000427BCB1|nr:NAD(P)/FAD-dependent oxidoreductase [Desulfatibacillum aliphaticivorans]